MIEKGNGEARPTIGLSFIFRNDCETIGKMLDSFLPYVDQVIATDTGSDDGSRKIVESKLRKFKGKSEILNFKWVEDFAAARQPGWDQLDTEWGLWCDADDTLEGGQSFALLIARADQQDAHGGQPPIGGFLFEYDYARTADGKNVCTLPRERLLRMSIGWKWTSPVHEVALAQAPCQFITTDSAKWIHHKVGDEAQGDRNLSIIQRHISDAEATGVDPDPRMLNYFGVEQAARGKHAEAVDAYKAYMKISGWGEEKHQALHRMADSYRAQGLFWNAIEVETYGITHATEHGVQEWPDHFIGVGESYMGMQQWDDAIRWIERGMTIPEPKSSMILNPRDYDYMPNLALSICHYEKNDLDKSEHYARKAIEIMPSEPKAIMHAHRVIVKRAEVDLTNHVIGTLEGLIAYDENLKAREAVRNLPYVVRGNERVFHLVNHIRRSTYQLGDVAGYAHMYATNREVRNPDDFVQDASERFGRAAFLKAGLERQRDELGKRPVYLDAGCNDGWMGAHMEHALDLVEQADGIDLNPEGVLAARDRAERFSLKGRYEEGFVENAPRIFGTNRYDAISMFEVFEHLENPHLSVAKLESALKPSGVMYISTPNGAFEKGLIDSSAWSSNENKQHLRAVTNSEFARFVLKRGELIAMESGETDGVQVVSYTPKQKKGHIVFWLGAAWDRWSPTDIESKGLGGSETAAVKMAEGLAAAGWFVEVYAGLTHEGPVNGVLFQNYTMYDADQHCDIFISSRDATAVSQLVPNAGVKILWCHDAHVGKQLKTYIGDWDEILCLTNDHVANVREFEDVQDSSYDDKFKLTRNGIDLSRWMAATPEVSRERVVIYSSSPDRGLEHLLEYWPEIRKRVRDAKLHVYYGFDVFDQMHANNSAMKAWKEGLVKKAKSLPGVELKGRVNQNELAKAQLAGRVWAYPYPLGNPTETSCITAMEAMGAGLVVVTTKTAALPETVGDAGVLIDGDPTELTYREQFINAVVDGLSDPEFRKRYVGLGRLRSASLSWDDVVEQWDSDFTTRLHDRLPDLP